jgi:hypothetical protein
MARNPLDRSAAFTALLELDPEGFGKSSDPESTKTITTFLDDFYQSGATNMYAYCREWLDARDDQVLETIRQAEEVQAAEAVPSAAKAGVPVDPDKPWQVTAQVCRSVDGWGSSRQVPTFTIPRALAYSKQDAQAKAREIINPYGEPYDIHMDVTTDYVTPERQAEAGRQVLDGEEQQLEAAQAEKPYQTVSDRPRAWNGTEMKDLMHPGRPVFEADREFARRHSILAAAADREPERGE